MDARSWSSAATAGERGDGGGSQHYLTGILHHFLILIYPRQQNKLIGEVSFPFFKNALISFAHAGLDVLRGQRQSSVRGRVSFSSPPPT